MYMRMHFELHGEAEYDIMKHSSIPVLYLQRCHLGSFQKMRTKGGHGGYHGTSTPVCASGGIHKTMNVPTGEIVEVQEASSHPVLLGGDQLTAARVRKAKKLEPTPFRMQHGWMV